MIHIWLKANVLKDVRRGTHLVDRAQWKDRRRLAPSVTASMVLGIYRRGAFLQGIPFSLFWDQVSVGWGIQDRVRVYVTLAR